MFFDPDENDAAITIPKFLAVLSSGMLAGETLYVSTTHLPSLLAMSNVGKALSNFRHFWPNGLQMYQTTLFGALTAFLVFMPEVRDRISWLYGALGLLTVFLYTRFYLCPRVANYLVDPELSKKGESQVHDMLVKFHHRHNLRTLLSFLSFTWLTYSLYMS